jgi:predicted ATP-grasp superfamily ATP-dependent carboligase
MRILITDGTERAALAAARSLVAAGYDVHVAASRRFSLAGVSRGVTSWAVGPDALEQPAAYAAALGRLARELRADVLLPVTDAAVEALLEHRQTLPAQATLPLPDLTSYRRASDKLQTLGLARAAGLTVPETVVLATPADWEHLPDAGFFPAVVKPHSSVVPANAPGSGKRKMGVSYAESPAACRAALATLPPEAFPVLLQRRVRGPGEGLFLLRWNGHVVAAFAHRRLREKPPAGGVSVYRESIDAPPDLVAAGTRLAELLDWRGVAMVECKRDLATGRYVFMEVNGRLWGSLQLAIDAGVDFPALLVACALGHPVAPVNGYRVGVRSRWFWGDVDHLYLRLTRSAQALHLDGAPAAAHSRLGATREFLRFGGALDREEIWRWRDPAPFIVETLGRLGLVR